MDLYSCVASTALDIPPRSHLYHLTPAGVGTPAVESLTGYIMRLAQAHSVSTRSLVADQLLPLYGRTYLLRNSLRLFWDEQTRALNGTNTSTRDLVHILESLTGCSALQGLTMLTWMNVLPPRGLLRSHRAWCPRCYAEWRVFGQVIYEPLIWALENVSVCPQHCLELCTLCPSCQSYLLPLEAQSRPGYCEHCGQWLGSIPKGCVAEARTSRQDISREVWVATEIGALLAYASSSTLSPIRERVAAVVSAYVAQAGGGSNAALARRLGCSKYTIRDCCRGAQLPQIGILLKLAEIAGVSLLRLLIDETLLLDLPPIVGSVAEQPASYHGPYRQVNKAQLSHRLQAEVANPTDPPNSLQAVAQQLGFDLSYLVKQCPDEAQLIKARYKTYVQRRKQRIREDSFTELRQIMTRMASEGIYPSQKRVAAQLSRSWFLRLPEARAAWRQMLAELGKVAPTDEVTRSPNLEVRT